METKTIEALANQGFSSDEIKEIAYMTTTIENARLEDSKINSFAIAYFEAERLTIQGSTEKIKELSKKVMQSLDQFKLITK